MQVHDKLKNQEGSHQVKMCIKYGRYVHVWLITCRYNVTNVRLVTLLTTVLTFLQ